MGAEIHGGWQQNRWFLLFACLCMAIPLVWPVIPPLTDLYGHMGRYKVQLDLDSSPYLKSFYDFEWQLVGNLGVDMLIIPMSKIFGLEHGVKLIILTIPVLTAAGLLWIAREVHGRVPPTAFFALPLAYSYPFLFGFVNFALSMALCFLAFALWISLERKGNERLRTWLFIPIGLLIWLSHNFGWGVLGLLIFAWEASKRFGNGKTAIQATWGAGLSCLPLLPPLLIMIAMLDPEKGGGTGDWFNLHAKGLWVVRTLQDRWAAFDIACLTVLFFIVILGSRSPWLITSPKLRLGSFLLLIAFLLLPRLALNGAYVDARLFPYALAIMLIGVNVSPAAGRTAVQAFGLAALVFLGVRLTALTASFMLYADRTEAALGALNFIPKGAKVISLVDDECFGAWPNARLNHLPAMAIVRRDAFSNDQWAISGQQLLSVKYTEALPFAEDPSQIVYRRECVEALRPVTLNQALASMPRAAFDYLWLINPQGLDPKLLNGTTQIWTNGVDALYRFDQKGSPPQKEDAVNALGRKKG
jgi:hypothetical protein